MKMGVERLNVGYILVLAVIVIALFATFAVGFSKENKSGDPNYDRTHGQKWKRLTVLYAITTLISLLALVWYISS